MINFLLFFLFGGAFAAAGGGNSSGGGASTATVPTTGSTPAPPTGDEGDADTDTDNPASGSDSGGSGSIGGDGTDTAPSLPDSAYDIGWVGLSPEEQLIVELINRARMDPQAEVTRLAEGLAAGVSSSPVEALAVNPELSAASDAHSQDMDNRDFFSHTNLSGETPSDRAIDAGYGSTYVGENIGWIGSTFAPSDVQARAEGHHANLWESDGHQQNLMSGNWNVLGVGYDYGSYLGYDGSTFVTEMFGNTGETYLTGVVIDDQDNDQFYDIGEGQGDVRVTAYAGDQAYATATWSSGGYTLALPPGTYRVVFEGGDLSQPYETEVTIGSENVKLDVLEDNGAALTSAAGLLVDDPGAALTQAFVGEEPADSSEEFLMLV